MSKYSFSNTFASIKQALIKDDQEQDPVSKKFWCSVRDGWLHKTKVHSIVKPYFAVAGEITIHEGLIMCGNYILMSEPMKNYIIEKLHTHHQKIKKCH